MSSPPTTGQILRDLPVGIFKTLQKIRPVGSLQARRQANGLIVFFWRYSIGKESERVSIGVYDSTAAPKSLCPTTKGYSIAAAARASEELALDHHAHKDLGGRPALVAAKQMAVRQEQAIKDLAEKGTLKNLLFHYCDHLEFLGRKSHLEARSVFKCHLLETWPQIADLPANQLDSEQFTDIIRKVIEQGKGRTSSKLRSYLRAAYQTAKTAKNRGTTPVHFKAYKVTLNPLDDTHTDPSFQRPDKNPLSIQDLRVYWQNIEKLPGKKGGVLRLHLLTGGQRIEQLVRLRTADTSDTEIKIFDGKGRPGSGFRAHIVPLVRDAIDALNQCHEEGEFALSTDQGKTHIAGTTLSGWAKEYSVGIVGFSAKRIRSGVETALARAGVSRDTRGRLQSHGISGVQAKHYDDYDYFSEKKAALQILRDLLIQPKACRPICDTSEATKQM